ncbi:hypothetical protein ACNI3K_09625 [Demequina sp. SO4-13]|uniref:hypothetical protein n=1 Tax=Demequina sp. SO4-13 TaxID=3401027 RepID=UPI003AF61884
MVLYRSRQHAHQNPIARGVLVATALACAALFGAGGMWSGPDESAAAAWWMGGVTLAVVLGLLLVPLTITVDDTHVRVSFAGVVKKAYPVDDVTAVEARTYRPVKDFGGWGWRWSHRLPHTVAYTTRGDTAVVLTLRGGGQVFLGVADEPGLLAALEPRVTA